HGQKYGKDADIYSLGITLYWLLNNRRMPFLNADEPITAMKNQEALRRRYEGEKLPAPKNGSAKLKQIVLKACAYRPEDRYRSAQELYDALSELSGGHTASYRKSAASGKASHTASPAGTAAGGSDFDDLFAAMNRDQSGAGSTEQAVQKKGLASGHFKSTGRSTSGDSLSDTSGTAGGAFSDGGTVSSGSKGTMNSTSATNASWGAGYSGKTEGNGWDDATNETIGQPKPKKKMSGASAGNAGKGQTSEPVEKTMGKAEAYKKQEKQMSERVAAMESVQASKKKEMPWWLGLIIAAALLVALYNRNAIFDWIGQKISGTSSSADYTFTYDDGSGYVAETDENGNTVLVKNYDADGNLKSKELSEYDSAGNRISLTKYTADDQVMHITDYDSQGRVIESLDYDEEGKPSYRITTEYGEDGHRSSQNEYNGDNQLQRQTTYEWVGDNITKEVETQYYGENGSISGYRVLENDDNGNHVSDTKYDSDWNVTSYTTDYQYDADGNLLQCTEYNGDGSISKKMVYYQQNEGDVLWKVRWYDADGNLTYDSGAKD
ncbi:MAG: protein kinase, partial [Lachnospiraceae bacterium]|nr:protein kinase [Lachnospiraceae bacterium]